MAAPRILFIAGFGRSGSTLLARVLAQVPGCVAVGELAQVWERGFAQNVRCGCGRPFGDCAFWRSVIREAFTGGEPSSGDVESLRRFWRQRGLPLFALRLLWTPRYRRLFTLYSEHAARLLIAAAKVSAATTVIDSSKNPAHLAALLAFPKLEVHVVHLVRDPRAVAYSWRGERTQSEEQRTDVPWVSLAPWQTALYWTAANIFAWWFGRRAASYRRVRYEDFARDPGGVLAALCGSALEIDDGTVELGTDHLVAGNPVRFFRGRLKIREDVEWQTKLSHRSRLAVTSLSWLLMRAYRYPHGRCVACIFRS